MINPTLGTSMRSELAQGHNVGDRDTDAAGVLWRWTGEKWEREPNSQQSPEHQITSPDDFINKIKQEMQLQMDELAKRTKEFDTSNPFAFDEALSRAAIGERYNPYYDAELSDFMKGIQLRTQSTQGQTELLKELNDIGVTKDQQALDQAIQRSEEGYAGAGLYQSGARARDTGLNKIVGQQTAQERSNQYGYNAAELGRTMTQIGNETATGQRKLAAAKTTDIETELAKQKAEEQARWQTERAQYIGYPYITSQTGGLNELLTSAFQA